MNNEIFENLMELKIMVDEMVEAATGIMDDDEADEVTMPKSVLRTMLGVMQKQTAALVSSNEAYSTLLDALKRR